MKNKRNLLLRTALSALLLLVAIPAYAATYTVSKLADADDGVCNADCSLREAITAANTLADTDTIKFTGLTGIVQLQSALPDIRSNLNLKGPGANLLTIRGEGVADPYRILNVGGGTVNISDLAFSNGRAVGGVTAQGAGGAIYNSGSLTLTRVNVHGNSAVGTGGGICNVGELHIVNSTVSGNTTADRGGALWNSGAATVSNSTLYGNSASLGAGAIRVFYGSVTLLNNTIASNSCDGANSLGGGVGMREGQSVTLGGNIIAGNSASSGLDVSGTVASSGFNLIGNGDGATGLSDGVNGDRIGTAASPLDPKLGPLVYNGGPTKTCALLSGSPAVNAGDPNFAPPPATDQRGPGFARVCDGRIDIGAFELQLFALSINDVTIAEGNSGTKDAIFTVRLDAPCPQPVTVKVATGTPSRIPATAGDDYVAVPLTTLTFQPGETAKTVAVKVNGDSVGEGDEKFVVKLSAASKAKIVDSEGFGTILDDDTSLSIGSLSVAEGNSGTINAVFTVTLSAAVNKVVTVNYATGNLSSVPAAAGTDYMAVPLSTLTFAAGQTSKTVTVKVNGDTLDEVDEKFAVNLSAPTGARITDGEGVCTITDDDAAPTLSINDVTQAEGDSGTTAFDFMVTLSATSGKTVTLKYQTTVPGTTPATPGVDYTAIPLTTLTFAPGETTKTVTVLVNGDTTVEGNEKFSVKLSNPANATITRSEGFGTITNDDAAALLFEDAPSE